MITPITANELCIDTKVDQDTCFKVELANTDKLRRKGLMYRLKLPRDHGMLFQFENEKKHTFWMKNTWIPLDIIWINKEMRIVDIKSNVQTCYIDPCPTYTPKEKALYVLEINAGLSRLFNIQKQQTIVLNK
tara:strand:+ start:295 stop:690 length:396 start_codon:yes stop_codon:yes gene_type:complete